MECFKRAESGGTKVVSYIGPGGAGKGTQAKFLAILMVSYKPVIITVSEVIGRYKQNFTDSLEGKIGEQLRKNAAELSKAEGVIVSNFDDKPVCDAINLEVNKALDAESKIVQLDGFPRTSSQGHKIIGYKNLILVNLINNLTQSLARAKKRREDAIRMGHKPREDDQPERVVKRFKTFARDTKPMLEEIKKSQSSSAVLTLQSAADLMDKTFKVMQRTGLLDRAQLAHASRRCFDFRDEACQFLATIPGYTANHYPTAEPPVYSTVTSNPTHVQPAYASA